MLDKIKKIISEQLGINENDITLDSSFSDDLGADSLDLVELLMAFSDEFMMEISDEEAEEIKTVGDVYEKLKDCE